MEDLDPEQMATRATERAFHRMPDIPVRVSVLESIASRIVSQNDRIEIKTDKLAERLDSIEKQLDRRAGADGLAKTVGSAIIVLLSAVASGATGFFLAGGSGGHHP